MRERRFNGTEVSALSQAMVARALRNLAAATALFAVSACSVADGRAPSSLSPKSGTPSVAVTHPRLSDTDPHEWDSGAPWNYAVHGTDVSKYQTSIDWRKARASGV